MIVDVFFSSNLEQFTLRKYVMQKKTNKGVD